MTVTGLLLWLPLVRLWMPLNIDFGEGWNAYVIQSVAKGRPLYQPLGSFAPNNYPPLSFYLLAWVHGVTGAPILMIGRLVSLGALLVVAIEIWWAARLCGATRICAWFGALVFLALLSAASPRYVGMNDPQMLAHAITEGALLLYLRWPIRRLGVMLPLQATVLTVGLFTKHNLVALPMAITADIAIAAPGLLVPWCVTLTGLVGAVTTFLTWQTGGLFLPNILTPRRYTLRGFIRTAAVASAAMLGPLVASIAACIRERARPGVRLILLYLATAMLVGLAFSAGSGADVNMFFSAFIALSIAVALALTSFEGSPHLQRAAAVAAVGWLALALPVRVLTPSRYRALVRRTADTAADVRFLRAAHGLAYCEQLLLCYWSDKPLFLQPYFAPELIAAQSISEASVGRLFDHRVLAVLQLDRAIGVRSSPVERRGGPAFRLNDHLLEIIERNYQLVYTSTNGAFYVPVVPARPPDWDAATP